MTRPTTPPETAGEAAPSDPLRRRARRSVPAGSDDAPSPDGCAEGGSPPPRTRRAAARHESPAARMAAGPIGGAALAGLSILCALFVASRVGRSGGGAGGVGPDSPYRPLGDRPSTERGADPAEAGAAPDGGGVAFASALVRDASAVRPGLWRTLVELSCRHGVGVRVLAGTGAEEGRAEVRALLSGYAARAGGAAAPCAPFSVESEDTDAVFGAGVSPPSNRVERIAALRDHQRALLLPEFLARPDGDPPGASIRNGVVVVIDLDLRSLPPASALAAQIDAMVRREHHHDVVCAAGVTMANRNELWYYDTYATVLLPDTYVHPLKRRLIKRHYPGEDPSLVRSDDAKNGNFTQGDLMRYLQSEGERSSSGAVSVRSCFGGLALYRAGVWLDDRCRYGGDPAGLDRYATEADGRPCEHVVFHDCLKGLGGDKDWDREVDVAIHPGLLTLWRKG